MFYAVPFYKSRHWVIGYHLESAKCSARMSKGTIALGQELMSVLTARDVLCPNGHRTFGLQQPKRLMKHAIALLTTSGNPRTDFKSAALKLS